MATHRVADVLVRQQSPGGVELSVVRSFVRLMLRLSSAACILTLSYYDQSHTTLCCLLLLLLLLLLSLLL